MEMWRIMNPDEIERILDSGDGATHSIDPRTNRCECDECFLYRLNAKSVRGSLRGGLPVLVRFDDDWLCGLTNGRSVIVWREIIRPPLKRSKESKGQHPTTSYEVCRLTSKQAGAWREYGLPREALVEARAKIDGLLARGHDDSYCE